MRKEKNLSQEQLAEILGVSRQSVSKWESDGGYPETEKLLQLAEKLDVSLDTLLLDRKNTVNTTDKTPSDREMPRPFDRKISIKSFNASVLTQCNSFAIRKTIFKTKKEPVCSIIGADTSNSLSQLSYELGGGQTLGWYATVEDAQKEMDEIYKAVQNGEAVYELKYNADVEVKAFGVKLKEVPVSVD
jgi:transcriptional regulator with XRE-family HTH domain